MPKRAAEIVKEELEIWGSRYAIVPFCYILSSSIASSFFLKRGVEGHFSHPKQREWKDIATHAATHLAPLIGG